MFSNQYYRADSFSPRGKNMENKTSSDPSIEKIVISVSEYDRLKRAEQDYQDLLQKHHSLNSKKYFNKLGVKY